MKEFTDFNNIDPQPLMVDINQSAEFPETDPVPDENIELEDFVSPEDDRSFGDY